MLYLQKIKDYILSVLSIEDKADSVIIKYVDRPVPYTRYVYKYKDRENLIKLQKKIDKLTDVALDSIYLKNNMKTREQLIEEINSLREYEDAVCLNKKQLAEYYKDHNFDLNPFFDELYEQELQVEPTHSDYPLKLYQIKINRAQNEIRIFFDGRYYVSLSEEIFSSKHPQIYSTLLASYNYMVQNSVVQNYVPDPTIHLVYKDRRTYFTKSFFLDPQSCFLMHGFFGDIRENLLTKMEEVQLENLQETYDEFDQVVRILNEQIFTEQRQIKKLLKAETTNISTQTMDFSIQESLLERLNLFLDDRGKISFKIATREGKNLSFDKQIIVSKKPQKNEILIQNVSFSEDNGVLNMSDSLLSLIQNPALMFAAALTTITVHNFQTIELAAQALLGFVHIPAYNDALIAATHLTINDLQTTYNLSQELAERADQILSFAYDIKYPETNWEINSNLSDNNADIPKLISWNKLFIAGALIIGTIGVGYLTYQVIKTGMPVDTLVSTIKNINPDV